MVGQKCSRISRWENIRIGSISRGSARGKGKKEVPWSSAGEDMFLLGVLMWEELISAVCFRAQFIFNLLEPTGLDNSKFH